MGLRTPEHGQRHAGSGVLSQVREERLCLMLASLMPGEWHPLQSL